MNAAACPRLFEAEAMRDGRLAGAELASFTRHATACAACRREVHALEALAEALRASPGTEAGADELHRLRQRTRLVAAFDAAMVAPLRGPGATLRMLRMLRPAAAAAMIAAALLFWRARSAPNADAAPSMVVHAAAGTTWSRRAEGDRETIVLERGELAIHVDHARRNTRLIVALPDGELEDTGTTFTVSAADGRTTRVAVEEGSVLLRLRGRPPFAIGRAESWTPEPPAAPSPAANVSTTTAPQGKRATPPAPAGPARRGWSAPPAAPRDAPDPAIDFRAAVALLDSGAHRDAAAALAQFRAAHARDPRAEDAAYLRVIALQRCGADDEARRAARDYLRLYPAGFRRAEMEKLSR